MVSFDNMSHEWTMKFIEHRVADRHMLRLIQKWLKAGVSEDGQWSETKVGTPQGAVVTPRTQKITSNLNRRSVDLRNSGVRKASAAHAGRGEQRQQASGEFPNRGPKGRVGPTGLCLLLGWLLKTIFGHYAGQDCNHGSGASRAQRSNGDPHSFLIYSVPRSRYEDAATSQRTRSRG